MSSLLRVFSHLPKAISDLPWVSFLVGTGYISAVSWQAADDKRERQEEAREYVIKG